MTRLLEFRSMISHAYADLGRLEQIHKTLRQSTRAANILGAVIDGNRRACESADKLIKSGRLEEFSRQSIAVESAMILFDASTAAANFHLNSFGRDYK